MTGRPIRSTCAYCGVGCGVRAAPRAGREVALAGDDGHPANRGRLCSKGLALGETLRLEKRLLFPAVNGMRAGWDEALDHVAGRLRETIERHGPDAVAFYVSGQFLTEDYYVANKLMKGFIGSGNIDSNSRLCMASAVAGHKRAFGADAVPGCYEDWECADLVVLVGSNAAWCHPVLYRRLLAARAARGTRLVVIDPRRTASCDEADLHLPIRPGADVRLFNALLAQLAERGAFDEGFLAAHTTGFEDTLKAARKQDASPAAVARDCGLEPEDVSTFFDWFARTARTLTVFSQGVNQSSQGVDKVSAIINCHLATGRIGKPGASPFSITGQPNAMGGREVGGLANMLAAHMEFGDGPAHRRLAAFWDTPRLAAKPGLKAVDMFRAVEAGKIRALWIMATNPAVSLPDATRVRKALGKCDFVVVSDCMAGTDTGHYADVLLPAAGWGEKDGTVTNSERRISRQRRFLEAPGEARPDWWIITEVARRMGFANAFPYKKAADIFREHAALSALGNNGTRAFDIGALAGLGDEDYDALAPVQWPFGRGQREGTARLFGDGRFYTPDGRARLVPVRPGAPANAVDRHFPYVLNTGRLRDQWHTMTRSGLSPRLAAHTPEPCVEIHPQDAAAARLEDGVLAHVRTRWGSGVFRVTLCAGQRRGALFLPIHWSDDFAAKAVVGRLANPATDPLSGQPALKHTPAAIAPFRTAWRGFLVSREEVQKPACAYWARRPVAGGQLYELAGEEGGAAMPALDELVGPAGAGGEHVEMRDPGRGLLRTARLEGGRLAHCLMLTQGGALPPRDWLASLLAAGRLEDPDRTTLLAGRRPGGSGDPGPIICACFGIGARAIWKAIHEDGLVTVEAIGEVLKAGTNCGSCRPEIKRLVMEAAQENAA
jgi:assimilatory nitrate reductase catalytic subunit